VSKEKNRENEEFRGLCPKAPPRKTLSKLSEKGKIEWKNHRSA